MKDLLQTSQTPYDILCLEPGASGADIDRAFKLGLVKRGNVQKLTMAKNILQRQDERLLLDLLRYDPRKFNGLDPNPQLDDSILRVVNRATTAEAWTNQLRSVFPDIDMVRHLAVFWYWWAVYEEERLAALAKAMNGQGSLKGDSKHEWLAIIRSTEGVVCDARNSRSCTSSDCQWQEDCLPEIPDVDVLWQKVIAYWVTLIRNLDQWQVEGLVITASLQKTLQESLEKQLRNQFHNLGQSYRNIGTGALAETYQKLDLELTTELRTSLEVENVGIRTARGKICCGRLMLEEVGLLPMVRKTVQSQLKNRPSSKTLRNLDDALSLYSSIAVLIDNNKPAQALEAIAQLRDEERALPEVMRLQVRALFKRGRQQVSLGEFSLALGSWGEALKTPADEVLIAEVKSLVISTCQDRSAALQAHQLDEAIALLEAGLALVDNENLRLSLGNLFTVRGIGTFVEAQRLFEQADQQQKREIFSDFERGLADLRRAAGMGNERAVEQAKAAEGFLQQVTTGFSNLPNLPDEIFHLLQKAHLAENEQNPDEAIIFFEKIILTMGAKVPEQVKNKLSSCLTQRGILVFVNAQSKLEKEGQELNKELITAFERGLADLKRAAEMGNERAIEQVKAAENFLQQVLTGFSNLADLSEEVLSLLQKARIAESKKNWDEAVTCFEQVIRRMKSKAPKQVKVKLSSYLNSRAVTKAEKAQKMMEGWQLSKFNQAIHGKWL